MPTVNLAPTFGVGWQALDNSGSVLTGGKLYTYAAGTTTPAATYTTSTGNVAHANPIILDSAGRVQSGGEIWLVNGVAYKFVLKTSTDTLITTYDNIANITDSSQITYDPPFTGSVPTNVEAKLAQYVSVKDFGAVGDGVTDDTAAIQAAVLYIQTLGTFNIVTGAWPATPEWTLYFPSGTYLVSQPIASPAGSTPNFVNFNLKGDNAIIKASVTYTASNSLIHMKAIFNYTIEGLAFDGFGTYYVIFNDSSLTQNYGGQCFYRGLRFANCEYGIRHELESVVAVIEDCETDANMIQFLTVWRCDQMAIRDCFFNWDQTNRVTGDPYIAFGTDEYPNPETDTAHYNAGRLLIENCMAIPINTPIVEARTAWIKMISGSLTVRNCHFGPEASNNRPFTVWSRIQGARYNGIYELVDAGISIEDSSCVNSWGMIYLDSYYPNYIHVRNTRWNALDYSPNATQRFLVSGDPGVLNPLSTSGYYTADMSKFFKFDFGQSVPQDNALIPFNPNLLFPKFISTYAEIALEDSYDTLTTPNQYAFFDIFDRNTLKPNFYEGAALYDLTLTGKMVNSTGPTEYNVSYKGVIEVSTAGAIMYVDYGPLYATSRSTPAPVVISALLYDIPGASEMASQTIAAVVAGNYCLRIKAYTANINTTWNGVQAKIRRIT